MRKILISLFVILCLCCGCSASESEKASSFSESGIAGNGSEYQKEYADVAEDSESFMEDAEVKTADKTEPGDTDNDQKKQENQDTQEMKEQKKEEKLVYTCDMSIETTTYKDTMEEIEKVIKKYSGIIDSQNESDEDYNWYYSDHEKTGGTMRSTIIVRIPSKNYQSFLKDLDDKGKITNKSMNVENISRTYYDTKAVIESLQIQEKRLLGMMEKAKEIKEMIEIENRLTEVQTKINQYKTQLSGMDTDVAYSTVTIHISEVLEYKKNVSGKKTLHFSDRLINTIRESASGFLSFMENMLFLCIRLLPFALLFSIIWYLLRPIRRKRAEKKIQKLKKNGEKTGQKV